MNEENQREYSRYTNEQLEILKNHFSRIMLRVLNKAVELEDKLPKIV